LIPRINRRKFTDEQVIYYYQHRNYDTNKISKLLNVNTSSVIRRLKILGFKLKKHDIKKCSGNLRHGYYKVTTTYKKLHPKCEICGWKYHVDLHHILELSNGGTNDIKNLICLCPNHHKLVHLGIIKINKDSDMLFIEDKTEKLIELDGGDKFG